MAEAKILQKMGPTNKKDLKRWKRQEGNKQRRISDAWRDWNKRDSTTK